MVSVSSGVKTDIRVMQASRGRPLISIEHDPDDLALVDLDLVAGELAGARVPAPDPQRSLVAHRSTLLPSSRALRLVVPEARQWAERKVSPPPRQIRGARPVPRRSCTCAAR